MTPKRKELTKVLHEELDHTVVLIHSTPKKRWGNMSKYPRSSKYRGVSKNGRKWQVSYIINRPKDI